MKAVMVTAGACGFDTRVEVHPKGKFTYALTFDTKCPYLLNFVRELPSFNLVEEMRNVFGVKIRDAALKTIMGSCAGCAVIPAIFKAAQVESGFALACTSAINFE
ncbi:MAG: hypothetical protein K8I29_15960 [Alphaproteobacteria bacterium]|uniref:Uncharacterized protein n=1 Tax=Candidatus Nitrobium versatile TaxID=2884831 RepID=A0A953JFG8_9BACT|nr:hypothetical protein [Candidatus Nitrobium versatile]